MKENKDSYTEHALLDVEGVKRYAVQKLHLFEKVDGLQAEEIGDGNINYVFRVWDPTTNVSIIIKQADVYLRTSGRVLDVYRNKIEATILQLEGKLAKGYVPEVYAYDAQMCTLAMEDISAYKNMRLQLMDAQIYPHFAQEIAIFLAKTLLPTSDLVLASAKKKDYVHMFINKDLCDISERLVFSEPYTNDLDRNVITKGNEAFVQKNLYDNNRLQEHVAVLREKFMNHAQSLLHGDLHTGSIFINEEGIKIIDPEFAFYGPMGYDIGNVIGNLFFAWGRAMFMQPYHAPFVDWCAQSIAAIMDTTMQQIAKEYEVCVHFPLYQNEGFKSQYLANILADSLGYAGTEIIRRVVGDSKVIELTSIQDIEKRLMVERSLIKMGSWLIQNRSTITRSADVVAQFFNICRIREEGGTYETTGL